MFCRTCNSIEYGIEYKRNEDEVGNETQEGILRLLIGFWSKETRHACYIQYSMSSYMGGRKEK